MQKNLLLKSFNVFLLFCGLLPTRVSAQNTQSGFENLITKAQEICEKLDLKLIINALFSDMISFSKEVFAAFCICMCILVITSVFNILKTSFGKSFDILDCLTSTLLILYSYRIFALCFDKVQSHITSLCGLMVSFVPVQTALYASSGATLTASASSSAGSLSISIIELISCSVIIPLIKVIFTVNTINVLCRDMNFSGISSFLKSLVLWVTGLSFTLLSGVLALQTTLNIAADSLMLKGIRFGASRLIPIAGGLISESLRTVLSSVSYIKNVTGIAGIILIIYSIIPAFSAVIISKILFSLLGAFSKVTNNTFISSFTDGVGACINILCALLSGCAVAFIIMLTLFIKTTVSL